MRRINDVSARKMLALSVEFIRGDKRKLCAGCMRARPLKQFSTRLYKGQRMLISQCKDCIKAGKLTLDKLPEKIVFRGASIYMKKNPHYAPPVSK